MVNPQTQGAFTVTEYCTCVFCRVWYEGFWLDEELTHCKGCGEVFRLGTEGVCIYDKR
jgi:hypothetical protein